MTKASFNNPDRDYLADQLARNMLKWFPGRNKDRPAEQIATDAVRHAYKIEDNLDSLSRVISKAGGVRAIEARIVAIIKERTNDH